jgi:hypothetical protein
MEERVPIARLPERRVYAWRRQSGGMAGEDVAPRKNLTILKRDIADGSSFPSGAAAEGKQKKRNGCRPGRTTPLHSSNNLNSRPAITN